jgi:transcriptional/translational regulatory protein YebC/TACO1
METALESGAEDFAAEGEVFEIYTEPDDLFAVKEALEAAGYSILSAEQDKIPSNYVTLDNEEDIKFMLIPSDPADEKDIILDDAATTWENNSDAYKVIGVGQQSLEYMYTYNKLHEKLFDAIYGEKGTKPVKEEDLKKHVVEKYDSVHYFAVSLKDASNKKLSKEEQNKIEDELEALAEKLNGGEKFDKIVAEYNEKHSDKKVTSNNRIGVMKDQFATDLFKKLEKCDPGSAIVVEYSDQMYLLFRDKIENAVDDYLKENSDAIRHELKDEEYSEYLEKTEKDLKIEINDEAVKKYSPKWIENRAG